MCLQYLCQGFFIPLPFPYFHHRVSDVTIFICFQYFVLVTFVTNIIHTLGVFAVFTLLLWAVAFSLQGLSGFFVSLLLLSRRDRRVWLSVATVFGLSKTLVGLHVADDCMSLSVCCLTYDFSPVTIYQYIHICIQEIIYLFDCLYSEHWRCRCYMNQTRYLITGHKATSKKPIAAWSEIRSNICPDMI